MRRKFDKVPIHDILLNRLFLVSLVLASGHMPYSAQHAVFLVLSQKVHQILQPEINNMLEKYLYVNVQ